MYAWEYKTIKFFTQFRTFSPSKIDDVELEAVLNEFGARGWELVSILPVTRANGGLQEFVAVLKREVDS